MPADTQFEEGEGTANPNVPLTRDPTDTSPGKHAILMVPDFKNVATTRAGAPMTSYLRLGDAHTHAGDAARRDLGEDLASMVRGFTDDLRDRDGGTGDDASPLESFPNPPGTAPPGVDLPPAGASLTTDQRRAESKILHSKGGWRDHSDGNRITTTRGDKVEVIRGNYKLLVLGRSDGFGDAAGMELSGGNLDTSSEDLAFASGLDGPGDTTRDVALLQTTFEWHASEGDGHRGWKQTIKTGHPDHTLGSNGQVISKTWLDLQETDLGSPEQWVRHVISNTYAVTSDDTLNAGTTTQTVNAGTVNQYTNASDTLRNGIVAGLVNNTTSARIMSNLTDVAVQSSIQAVGANFIGNAFGIQAEVDVGWTLDFVLQLIPVIINVQVAGTILSQFIATCIDNHTGLHVDNHTGVHADNHVGVHVDLHAGVHAQFDNTAGQVTIHQAGYTRIAQAYGLAMSGTTVEANEEAVIAMATAHMHM